MTILLALTWFFVSDSTLTVVHKVADSTTIHLLNSIEILNEVDTDDICVRVIEIRNDPGSARQLNGEVTSNIYFAVSEHGDYPEQNLFLIKSLYGPKIERIEKNKDTVDILLSFVVNSNRQNILVSVSLTNCVVHKK